MKNTQTRRALALLLALALMLGYTPVTQAANGPSGEKIVYGYSGEGRELCAYRYGSGENVFVIGFAIHGFEDNFHQDGRALVYTAQQLMANLESTNLAVKHNWTVYVLPCMNPDGLESGYTNDGPGRCTTMRYNENGELVKGGVDLNRCFPTGFSPQYEDRNYTGREPLAAKEARALAEFLKKVKGRGTNLLVDTHGWYQQTIVFNASSLLLKAFQAHFPTNQKTITRGAPGYLINYGRSLGYESCLFEFPGRIYSMGQFRDSGCCEKYISAITDILRTQPHVCAGGHDLTVERQEPTCDRDGWEVQTCTRCGDTLRTELPAPGHQPVEGTVVTVQSPTATQAGLVLCQCARCGDDGVQIPLPRVFSDTRPDAYYCGAVDYAYAHGLINGTSDTAFSPNGTLSRAMLVTLLHRIAGSPEAAGIHRFADVPEDAYFAGAVAWAYENGIVTGMSDIRFQPNTPVTRQQTAAILCRYVTRTAGTGGSRADLSRFADQDRISPYARDAMAWCVAAGILQGVTGTTLVPGGTATRAQGTVMLYRVIQYLENTAE